MAQSKENAMFAKKTKVSKPSDLHLETHKISKPIVSKIFDVMWGLLVKSGSCKDYNILSIAKLHTDFNTHHTDLTTALFWFLLYKEPSNRDFDSVDFCRGCKNYSLHKNSVEFKYKRLIDDFYNKTVCDLIGINPASKDYINIIVYNFQENFQ